MEVIDDCSDSKKVMDGFWPGVCENVESSEKSEEEEEEVTCLSSKFLTHVVGDHNRIL